MSLVEKQNPHPIMKQVP